jgi:hypothetical protein
VKVTCSGKISWRNAQGEVITQLEEYDDIQFMPGYIVVMDGAYYGALDTSFNTLLPLSDQGIVNRQSPTMFCVSIEPDSRSRSVRVFKNINGTKYYEK